MFFSCPMNVGSENSSYRISPKGAAENHNGQKHSYQVSIIQGQFIQRLEPRTIWKENGISSSCFLLLSLHISGEHTQLGSAMATAQPFRKNKLALRLGLMLQLQDRKGIIKTATREKANGNHSSLRVLCKQGQLKEALHILHIMDEYTGSATYDSLLQGCLDNKSLPEGKLVHAHIIQTGFKFQSNSLENKLVSTYAKCGSLVDARRAFNQMPKRNIVSWTLMIAAYARQGHGQEALTLFYEIQRTGIRPDRIAYASVLSACANLAFLEQGKEIHEAIITSGLQCDVLVGNALVDMYAKCGCLEVARHEFDKMPQRDVVSWNAMIAGYAQNGLIDEAFKLFQEMPEQNVVSWTAMVAGYAQKGNIEKALELFQKMPERNVVSWNAMIAGYAQNGHVDEALKLFQTMPEKNVVSWNAMITLYAHNGYVDEALKLFQQMPRRDVISWNAMIAGYAQNGYDEEALKFFEQMQLTGMEPNSKTFASVLPACANLAALEKGKEIHEEIIRCGFQSDVFVGSALVDMYAKCGSVENARNLFDKMPRRNVVSWTAMIAGYAMHGCGKEALKLFEQMQQSGINPNPVTLVGVLSACCHAGLVNEGRQYFDYMSQYYHITPAMEHYGCMVDLLGRAGHLDEAQDFINKMPIKPDATMLGCLLGACRSHNNIELGERVAECLFELDPKSPTPYVLLSNMYARAGRWNDTEKVRTMMKERIVKKQPGCSWIEVNKQIHAFHVGDRSHPQLQKIYTKLERLSKQMKAAGYVPDTRFLLNDVEES